MEASLEMSALQLEGYYVTELAFKVSPVQEAPKFNLQIGIGVQYEGIYTPDPLTINVQAAAAQHAQEPLRWQHVLTVTSENPPERKYPYDFKITLVGYFVVSEEVPLDRREAFVKINAASVLYSAAREYLATATGRGPLPSVVLPTVVFGLTPEKEPAPKTLAEGKTKAKKTTKKAMKKKATKRVGSKKQQR